MQCMCNVHLFKKNTQFKNVFSLKANVFLNWSNSTLLLLTKWNFAQASQQPQAIAGSQGTEMYRLALFTEGS